MRTKAIILIIFLVFVSMAGFTARVMLNGPKCEAEKTSAARMVSETNYFIE